MLKNKIMSRLLFSICDKFYNYTDILYQIDGDLS